MLDLLELQRLAVRPTGSAKLDNLLLRMLEGCRNARHDPAYCARQLADRAAWLDRDFAELARLAARDVPLPPHFDGVDAYSLTLAISTLRAMARVAERALETEAA